MSFGIVACYRACNFKIIVLYLLEHFCGEDFIKWQEATQAAREALQARYDFG